MPKGKNPRPSPISRPGCSGSAVTPWTSASSEVPPSSIGPDIIAAPALDPASSPPAAWVARIAASAADSRPSGASIAVILAWSPPVK